MSDNAEREILVAGAHALARVDGLGPSLQVLIATIAGQLEVESAAIVVADRPGDALRIVATYGLADTATAGLAEAISNPAHPIARTLATPIPTFDVTPINPVGPALRSHIPLIVTRAGRDTVLGVLALAHSRPIEEGRRPVVQAGADLAAAAIERNVTGVEDVG